MKKINLIATLIFTFGIVASAQVKVPKEKKTIITQAQSYSRAVSLLQAISLAGHGDNPKERFVLS